MQVFISWSGPASKAIAQELAGWLKHVLWDLDTFVSTQDIAAGERWEARLSEQLDSTRHAVLCVTRDNQHAPWLVYEAGALSKIVGRGKVVPMTLGFPPQEMLVGPLSGFQGVQGDRTGTWDLVRSLNSSLPTPRDEAFLRRTFEKWWPDLEESIGRALAISPSALKDNVPSDQELLLELRRDMKRVLEYVRRGEMSEVQKQQETIEVLTRDPLTQLPNRRSLAARVAELQASSVPFAMAFVDLDGIKRINDTQGHIEGDRILSLAARILVESTDDQNFVSRWGGDEFVVIFPNTSTESAEKQIRGFLAEFSNAAYTTKNGNASASVGLSTRRVDSFDSHLRDADAALFRAKRLGGGTCVVGDK